MLRRAEANALPRHRLGHLCPRRARRQPGAVGSKDCANRTQNCARVGGDGPVHPSTQTNTKHGLVLFRFRRVLVGLVRFARVRSLTQNTYVHSSLDRMKASLLCSPPVLGTTPPRRSSSVGVPWRMRGAAPWRWRRGTGGCLSMRWRSFPSSRSASSPSTTPRGRARSPRARTPKEYGAI